MYNSKISICVQHGKICAMHKRSKSLYPYMFSWCANDPVAYVAFVKYANVFCFVDFIAHTGQCTVDVFICEGSCKDGRMWHNWAAEFSIDCTCHVFEPHPTTFPTKNPNNEATLPAFYTFYCIFKFLWVILAYFGYFLLLLYLLYFSFLLRKSRSNSLKFSKCFFAT